MKYCFLKEQTILNSLFYFGEKRSAKQEGSLAVSESARVVQKN